MPKKSNINILNHFKKSNWVFFIFLFLIRISNLKSMPYARGQIKLIICINLKKHELVEMREKERFCHLKMASLSAQSTILRYIYFFKRKLDLKLCLTVHTTRTLSIVELTLCIPIIYVSKLYKWYWRERYWSLQNIYIFWV